MLKLNGAPATCSSEQQTPLYSSERSWSTLSSMDSAAESAAVSEAQDSPGMRGGYFRRVNHDQLSQSGSSMTHEGDELEDEVQPRRDALMSEVLAELHAFAEHVLYQTTVEADGNTPSASQQQSGPAIRTISTHDSKLKTEYEVQNHERCKRILCHLTTLCDEEDDEEEEEEEEQEDRSGKGHGIDDPRSGFRARSRISSTSGTAAISVPLPKDCRIASPLRLLTCYFEMLSDLFDLQIDERKKILSERKYQSDLIDLSAAFLRVLVTPSSPSPGAESHSQSHRLSERSKCEFGLYVLHQLGAFLHLVPGPLSDWCSFRPATPSVESWFPYTDQIKLALGEYREWLIRIVGRELEDERRVVSGSTSGEQNYEQNNYCQSVELSRQKLLRNLSEAACDTEWLEKIFGSKEDHKHKTGTSTSKSPSRLSFSVKGIVSVIENSHELSWNQTDISWDWLIDCCQLEVQSLQKCLDIDLHPIPPLDTQTTTEKPDDKSDLHLTQWFENEMEVWRKKKVFIREHCSELPIMANLVQRIRNTDGFELSAVKQGTVQAILRDIEEVHTQALEHYALLDYYEHLLRLPDGLQFLIGCLDEFSRQINDHEKDTFDASVLSDRLSTWELQLRQLQHRLCLELSFLRTVHTHRSDYPAEWIESWTRQLSKAYHSVIRRLALLRAHLQQEWLVQAYDAWVGCAEELVDQISPMGGHENPVRFDETMFTRAWTLLQDAELLQQTYWLSNRERLRSTKTSHPAPPTEFTAYLRVIRSYVDRSIAACKLDPDHVIISLLQSMEHSSREKGSSTVLLELIDCVQNGSINERQNPDKLSTLIHALRDHQRNWERRLRLTQRSIDVAADPAFARSRHVSFVRGWIDSVGLRRDWQWKIIYALGRILRASEVVDAERFPIRPSTTFVARLIPDELLRQEQTFIEAIHYALDLYRLEIGLIHTGVSVCDSRTSSTTCPLVEILDELKQLLTHMVHDPQLGQTGGMDKPENNFTVFLRNRQLEAEKLWVRTKLMTQIEWALSSTENVSASDATGLNLWLDQVATGFLQSATACHDSRLLRLQHISNDWDRYKVKHESVNISAGRVGFTWTSISIDTEVITPLHPLNSSSTDIEPNRVDVIDKRIQRGLDELQQHISSKPRNPVNPANIRPRSTCLMHQIDLTTKQKNEDRSALAALKSEFFVSEERQKVDLVQLEQLLQRLIVLRPQRHPYEFKVPGTTEPPSSEWTTLMELVMDRLRTLWHDVLTKKDGNVELTAFWKRWCHQITQGNSSGGPILNGHEETVNLDDGTHKFGPFLEQTETLYLMLTALSDALVTMENRAVDDARTPIGQSLPPWFASLKHELDDLIFWMPLMDLIQQTTCNDCRFAQIHSMLDAFEVESTSIKPFFMSADPINQLKALRQWIRYQWDSKSLLDPQSPDNDDKSVHKSHTTLMDRIDKITTHIATKIEASRIYQQVNQFMSEVVQLTDPIEPNDPVYMEDLCATLIALEHDLHSIPRAATHGSTMDVTHEFWLRQVDTLRALLFLSGRGSDGNSEPILIAPDSATPYHSLNQILFEADQIQTMLLADLRRALNTHVPSYVIEESTDSTALYTAQNSYDLCMNLPTEADLAHMFACTAQLDHFCREAQLLADCDYGDAIGLIIQPAGVRSKEPSVVYTLHLLKQLQAAILCSPQDLRKRVDKMQDKTKKLQDIISALSEYIHEASSIEHRLYMAMPMLTGRHMDELAKAVEELETIAAQCRLESTVPSDTHSKIGEHMRHAGQRLMELETALEHGCESMRILLLLSIGDRLWTYTPEQRLSVNERSTALQADYEHSFGYAQLRAAWTRLAQMGDRLGRIQAGLPIRPSLESEVAEWDNDSITQRHSPESGAHSSVTNMGHDDRTSERISNTPTEHAEAVRRKRLRLRDLLGSHVCVYPECKQAKAEWICYATEISKDQVTIVEKIRKVFFELVHFYTHLKKDLIENRGPNSRQSVENSIRRASSREPRKTYITDWHQDVELTGKYEELMRHVDGLAKYDLPQIAKLREKAKSLEALWHGRNISMDELVSQREMEDYDLKVYPEMSTQEDDVCKSFTPKHSTDRSLNHTGTTKEDSRFADSHRKQEKGREIVNTVMTNENNAPQTCDQPSSGDLRDHFWPLSSEELGGIKPQNLVNTNPEQLYPVDHDPNFTKNAYTVSAIEAMNAAREASTRKSNKSRQKRKKQTTKRTKTSFGQETSGLTDTLQSTESQDKAVPLEEQTDSAQENLLDRKPDATRETSKKDEDFKGSFSVSEVNFGRESKESQSLPRETEKQLEPIVHSRMMDPTSSKPDDQVVTSNHLSKKPDDETKQQLASPASLSTTLPSWSESAPLASSSPMVLPCQKPVGIYDGPIRMSLKERMNPVQGISESVDVAADKHPMPITEHIVKQIKPDLKSNQPLPEKAKGNVFAHRPLGSENPLTHGKYDFVENPKQPDTQNHINQAFKSESPSNEFVWPTQLIDETVDTDPSWITVQKKPSRKPKQKKKSSSKKDKTAKQSDTFIPESNYTVHNTCDKVIGYKQDRISDLNDNIQTPDDKQISNNKLSIQPNKQQEQLQYQFTTHSYDVEIGEEPRSIDWSQSECPNSNTSHISFSESTNQQTDKITLVNNNVQDLNQTPDICVPYYRKPQTMNDLETRGESGKTCPRQLHPTDDRMVYSLDHSIADTSSTRQMQSNLTCKEVQQPRPSVPEPLNGQLVTEQKHATKFVKEGVYDENENLEINLSSNTKAQTVNSQDKSGATRPTPILEQSQPMNDKETPSLNHVVDVTLSTKPIQSAHLAKRAKESYGNVLDSSNGQIVTEHVCSSEPINEARPDEIEIYKISGFVKTKPQTVDNKVKGRKSSPTSPQQPCLADDLDVLLLDHLIDDTSSTKSLHSDNVSKEVKQSPSFAPASLNGKLSAENESKLVNEDKIGENENSKIGFSINTRPQSANNQDKSTECSLTSLQQPQPMDEKGVKPMDHVIDITVTTKPIQSGHTLKDAKRLRDFVPDRPNEQFVVEPLKECKHGNVETPKIGEFSDTKSPKGRESISKSLQQTHPQDDREVQSLDRVIDDISSTNPMHYDHVSKEVKQSHATVPDLLNEQLTIEHPKISVSSDGKPKNVNNQDKGGDSSPISIEEPYLSYDREVPSLDHVIDDSSNIRSMHSSRVSKGTKQSHASISSSLNGQLTTELTHDERDDDNENLEIINSSSTKSQSSSRQDKSRASSLTSLLEQLHPTDEKEPLSLDHVIDVSPNTEPMQSDNLPKGTRQLNGSALNPSIGQIVTKQMNGKYGEIENHNIGGFGETRLHTGKNQDRSRESSPTSRQQPHPTDDREILSLDHVVDIISSTKPIYSDRASIAVEQSHDATPDLMNGKLSTKQMPEPYLANGVKQDAIGNSKVRDSGDTETQTWNDQVKGGESSPNSLQQFHPPDEGQAPSLSRVVDVTSNIDSVHFDQSATESMRSHTVITKEGCPVRSLPHLADKNANPTITTEAKPMNSRDAHHSSSVNLVEIMHQSEKNSVQNNLITTLEQHSDSLSYPEMLNKSFALMTDGPSKSLPASQQRDTPSIVLSKGIGSLPYLDRREESQTANEKFPINISTKRDLPEDTIAFMKRWPRQSEYEFGTNVDSDVDMEIDSDGGYEDINYGIIKPNQLSSDDQSLERHVSDEFASSDKHNPAIGELGSPRSVLNTLTEQSVPLGMTEGTTNGKESISGTYSPQGISIGSRDSSTIQHHVNINNDSANKTNDEMVSKTLIKSPLDTKDDNNELEQKNEDDDEEEEDIPTLFGELSFSLEEELLSRSYPDFGDIGQETDDQRLRQRQHQNQQHRRSSLTDRPSLHPIMEHPLDPSVQGDEFLNGLNDDDLSDNDSVMNDSAHFSLTGDLDTSERSNVAYLRLPPSLTAPKSVLSTRKIKKARRRLEPRTRTHDKTYESSIEHTTSSFNENHLNKLETLLETAGVIPVKNEAEFADNQSSEGLLRKSETEVGNQKDNSLGYQAPTTSPKKPLYSQSACTVEEVQDSSIPYEIQKINSGNVLPTHSRVTTNMITIHDLPVYTEKPSTVKPTSLLDDNKFGPTQPLETLLKDETTTRSSSKAKMSLENKVNFTELAPFSLANPSDLEQFAAGVSSTDVNGAIPIEIDVKGRKSENLPGVQNITSSPPTSNNFDHKSIGSSRSPKLDNPLDQPYTQIDRRQKSSKSRRNRKPKADQKADYTDIIALPVETSAISESIELPIARSVRLKPGSSDSTSTSNINRSEPMLNNLIDGTVSPNPNPEVRSDPEKFDREQPQSRSTCDRSTQTSENGASDGQLIRLRHRITTEYDDQPSDRDVLSSHIDVGPVLAHKAVQTAESLIRDHSTIMDKSGGSAAKNILSEVVFRRHRPGERLSEVEHSTELAASSSRQSGTPKQTRSCCRYFLPILGLLLLLFPFILLSCLLLVPKCGSIFWTECREQSVLWRYFLRPFGIAHIRRPPQ